MWRRWQNITKHRLCLEKATIYLACMCLACLFSPVAIFLA
uniref:Uncharacterized protein n=1 Tax=Rhizophora mucronata TaxID=61149 RepID=A0A2P2JTT4_RHIMU